MAQYDKDTKKFMEDVAEPGLAAQAARSARSVVKQVAKGRPLSEALARQAITIPTFAAMEKSGSLKVLDLFELLNEHYKHAWWDWEPETIWQTLSHDHQIEPTEAIKNIVQALQVIVSTDQPFEHWHVFEKVGHAFNYNHVSFATLQPLEVDEIAVTVKLLRAIRPKAEFDKEVCAYMGACAKHSGIVYLPEPLFPACAQESLDELGNNVELKAQVEANKGRTLEGDGPLAVQLQRMRIVTEHAESA